MTVVIIAIKNFKSIQKGSGTSYQNIMKIIPDTDKDNIIRLVDEDNWEHLIDLNKYRIEIF